MKKHKIVSSWICYTLIRFECFQSFRYACRISEITVTDPLSAAALISFSLLKVRRLFQLQVKQKGECREKVVGQEKGQICTPRTVIWTWFRKFPYIKTIELTSGCGSCLSSDMVLISFYIKSRNKGGAFICKLNWRCGAYSRAAFIREAALSWSFTVTSLFFVKQEKMKDFPLPSPPLRCFHMHWLNFPFITYYAYNRAFWRHLSLEN